MGDEQDQQADVVHCGDCGQRIRDGQGHAVSCPRLGTQARPLRQEDVVVSCPDCGAEPGQHTDRCHFTNEARPLKAGGSGSYHEKVAGHSQKAIMTEEPYREFMAPKEVVGTSCPDCGVAGGRHSYSSPPCPRNPLKPGTTLYCGTTCPECWRHPEDEGHKPGCSIWASETLLEARLRAASDKGWPKIEGCICGMDERDPKDRHSQECWSAAERRVQSGGGFKPEFLHAPETRPESRTFQDATRDLRWSREPKVQTCGECGRPESWEPAPSWTHCPCGQASRPGGDTRTNVYRGDELVEVRYPHADGVQCCWTREKKR